jgi:hypothetical protein
VAWQPVTWLDASCGPFDEREVPGQYPGIRTRRSEAIECRVQTTESGATPSYSAAVRDARSSTAAALYLLLRLVDMLLACKLAAGLNGSLASPRPGHYSWVLLFSGVTGANPIRLRRHKLLAGSLTCLMATSN